MESDAVAADLWAARRAAVCLVSCRDPDPGYSLRDGANARVDNSTEHCCDRY